MRPGVLLLGLATLLLFCASVVSASDSLHIFTYLDEFFPDIETKEKKEAQVTVQKKRVVKSKVNIPTNPNVKHKDSPTNIYEPEEKNLLGPFDRTVQYGFRELNLLKEDMVLRGINPAYDFYIPVYRNLKETTVNLRLTIPEYLRQDSSVSVLVDDIPYYTMTMKDSGRPIRLDIKPKRNKDYIKISIKGNLRLSNNICEDVFSDKPYLLIHADSIITFTYKQAEDITTFLLDYERDFCIEEEELLPLVYYLSKVRSIPTIFHWGIKDNCKVIKLSQDINKLEGKTLYVSKSLIQALQHGYKPLIFGKSVKINQMTERETTKYREISIRELGIRTSSVKGMANLSFYIPLNLASFGGMPDTLYLRLNFAHTPVHQKDKMELRVYLNETLIKTLPLEGYGTKSLDIKIPTQELSYGHNTLVVNLVNFTSSDNCFGAITQSVLTVFDDSYFYWNSVSKRVRTIADFFKMVNGKVGIYIEDKKLIPFAAKLLNSLTEMNKNINLIQLTDKKDGNYDYFISLVKPDNKKGLFEIYDPTNGKIVFSAKYELPFIYLTLIDASSPELKVSSYGNPDITTFSDKYSIDDYLNLYGNVAVVAENYLASFETGEKLRVKYEGERGLGYYWVKYRLLIIILISIPVLYLLIHTYRKLTRRAT